IFLIAAMVSPGSVAASDFQLVSEKSRVEFRIKHLAVGVVEGRFAGVTGRLKLDPSGKTVQKLESIIEVQSLTTGIGYRDDELKGNSFLRADRFPEISFSSKQSDSTGSGTKVMGILKWGGSSKQVVFHAGIPEFQKGSHGKMQVVVSGYVDIKRSALGLKLNNPRDKDDSWLDDDVQVVVTLIGQEI